MTEIENLDFPPGELSPAELAELAEEGEPMLKMENLIFQRMSRRLLHLTKPLKISKKKYDCRKIGS